MKNLLVKLARYILKDVLFKLEKEKKEAEESIIRVQNTLGAIVTHTEDKVRKLEGIIIKRQEMQQKLFYNKEKTLLELLSTNVIDQKEHYYSQRLLKEIEKELDVIETVQ